MRNSDYGLKIGEAYNAIAKMHGDIKKLLFDCDSLLDEGKAIYENTVVSDLSYSINASWWFAQYVFRFWDIKKDFVVGVTIPLYGNKLIKEPILICGKIRYKRSEDGEVNLKHACYRWDLWNAYLFWSGDTKHGSLVRLEMPEKNDDRIEWIEYISHPLFNIESFDDIRNIFAELKI